MANVINGADYLTIATNYANARDTILAAGSHLFDAVYTIVLLQDIYPTVDLVQEFWDSYLLNTDLYNSPLTLLNAVRILNSHVLNRDTTAETLDDYLDNEGITVPRSWADLCSATGFPIQDPTNIDV